MLGIDSVPASRPVPMGAKWTSTAHSCLGWSEAPHSDFTGNPGVDEMLPRSSVAVPMLPMLSRCEGPDVPTRNVLYKGNGDGTFTYTGDMAGLEIGHTGRG